MKTLIVILVLVGACAAQQQQQKFSAVQSGSEIVITKSEQENNGDGTFRWISELSDGNRHEQSGYIKAGPEPDKPIQVIQGTFSYISPEGQQIDLQYIADENGFQPIGAHVPRLPQTGGGQAQPQQQQQQQYRPRP